MNEYIVVLQTLSKTLCSFYQIEKYKQIQNELERIKSCIESLGNYIAIIRYDITSLLHVSFRTGCKNLEYALSSRGTNQCNYIQSALNSFIEASTIENNINLILSFIGITICQLYFNDQENAKKTLEKIKSVKYTPSTISFKQLSWEKQTELNQRVYSLLIKQNLLIQPLVVAQYLEQKEALAINLYNNDLRKDFESFKDHVLKTLVLKKEVLYDR